MNGLLLGEQPKDGSGLYWQADNLTGKEVPGKWFKVLLQEKEVLYRTLMDNSPDGIILMDLNADIIKANQQTARMCGVEDTDFFVGRNVFQYISEKDLERAREDWRCLIVSGKNKSLQYSIKRKDGTPFYIEVNTSVIMDDEGKPKALMGILRDISTRKRTEDAFIESERRFKLITENMLDGLIICDSSYIFQYVNPAFERSVGIPCGDIVGRYIFEHVHPEDLPGLKDSTEKSFKMKSDCRATYRYMAASGKYLWFESNAKKFYDKKGKFKGLVIANRDITERIQLEKGMSSLDRVNLVGQMAAGIGHEIRNPMTTVRGLLQILGRKSEFDSYKEYFDIMMEELDRVNSVISEFLTIAKNKPADLEWKNINTIIELVSPLFMAGRANSGDRVTLNLSERPDMQLNEKDIGQLIINLIRNGLEAMEKGGELVINTFTEGEEVVLAVQDHGSGIDPELLDKIGTPFFTTKEYGTGLGLAVCYSVAARHGAVIDVETGSAGTTFYVRFKENR
ncbi:MAG: PAS domain S-box protein [Desulfocucumaceae bacterium]